MALTDKIDYNLSAAERAYLGIPPNAMLARWRDESIASEILVLRDSEWAVRCAVPDEEIVNARDPYQLIMDKIRYMAGRLKHRRHLTPPAQTKRPPKPPKIQCPSQRVKCRYCHEYSVPTPLGHCPNCGAGLPDEK
jgi:hypothetical protein